MLNLPRTKSGVHNFKTTCSLILHIRSSHHFWRYVFGRSLPSVFSLFYQIFACPLVFIHLYLISLEHHTRNSVDISSGTVQIYRSGCTRISHLHTFHGWLTVRASQLADAAGLSTTCSGSLRISRSTCLRSCLCGLSGMLSSESTNTSGLFLAFPFETQS